MAHSPRVLLADDDPLNREILCRLLERIGARVDAVADGAQAVGRALEERYDLVILDLTMPVKAGIEAARAIREAESGSGRKPMSVIALTGADEDLAWRDAGFDDFLQKPVAMAVLASAVKRWTEGGET